jgi:hypothetical protein
MTEQPSLAESSEEGYGSKLAVDDDKGYNIKMNPEG